MRRLCFTLVALLGMAHAAVAQSVPGTGCPLPARPVLGSTTLTPGTTASFAYFPCGAQPLSYVIVGVRGPQFTLSGFTCPSPIPCATVCQPPYLSAVVACSPAAGTFNLQVPAGLAPGLQFCMHKGCLVFGAGGGLCLQLSESLIVST